MLGKLWYNRPVRIQLLASVGLVNLLAAVLAVAVSVLNARTATRVEIDSSLELAERFVEATLKELTAQGKLDQLATELPSRIRDVRHVRIMLLDHKGQLAVISPPAEEPEESAPPAWFAYLVGAPSERAVRVVASNSTTPIVVVGEPADEIAEAWQEFYSLAIIWFILEGLILAILYLVVGRILEPLSKLGRAIMELEVGQYATRLKTPRMKELAAVANRFNMLAAALESAREENSHLYRRLITVQEEERREIASELHDEAGPCLFGITANAKSIQSMSEKIADPGAAQIHRRVAEVLSITERLRQLNRAMLKKLRPGSGQRAGISGLIEELVAGFIRRHPGTEIVYTAGELANSYGESLDLTLYRAVQEGIVNAIRHGKAQHVDVDLGEELSEVSRKGKRRSGKLSLTIRDDGRGVDPSTPRGFGLTAMNERVKAHGGSCVIKSGRGKGTTISIDIPFGNAAEEPRAAELVGEMT